MGIIQVTQEVYPSPAMFVQPWPQPLSTATSGLPVSPLLTDSLGSHPMRSWGVGVNSGSALQCYLEICSDSSSPALQPPPLLNPGPSLQPGLQTAPRVGRGKWRCQRAPLQRGLGDMRRPPTGKSWETRKALEKKSYFPSKQYLLGS